MHKKRLPPQETALHVSFNLSMINYNLLDNGFAVTFNPEIIDPFWQGGKVNRPGKLPINGEVVIFENNRAENIENRKLHCHGTGCIQCQVYLAGSGVGVNHEADGVVLIDSKGTPYDYLFGI